MVDSEHRNFLSLHYLDICFTPKYNSLQFKAGPNDICNIYLDQEMNYSAIFQNLLISLFKLGNLNKNTDCSKSVKVVDNTNTILFSHDHQNITTHVKKCKTEKIFFYVSNTNEDKNKCVFIFSEMCVHKILFWSKKTYLKKIITLLPLSYNINPLFLNCNSKKDFLIMSSKEIFKFYIDSQNIELFFQYIKDMSKSFFTKSDYDLSKKTQMLKIIYQFRGKFDGDILLHLFCLGYLSSLETDFYSNMDSDFDKNMACLL